MKADILSMKKFVGISLVLTSMLLLSGCFGSPDNTSEMNQDDPRLSTEITMKPLNPLVAGNTEPVQALETPDSLITVFYAGLGYPNITENSVFSGDEKEGTELVGDERVIGVAYKVTNTGSEAIQYSPLTWSAPTLNGIESKVASSQTSLASMAGYEDQPYGYTETTEIPPGTTLTWSFVVLIPEELRNVQSVNFSQSVTWKETSLVSEFSFSTIEPEIVKPTEAPEE